MARSFHYMVHTAPGLERIAWKEIAARVPGAHRPRYFEVPRRNGIVVFQSAEPLHDLCDLRLAEDVFVVLTQARVRWGYQGQAQAYDHVLKDQSIRSALSAHNLLPGGRRGTGTLRFRMVTRLSGKQQPYRRSDLGRSLATALVKQSNGRWQEVREGEQFEVWANLIREDFFLAARLSDASMRHRDYKEAHLPASLRPTVAAAMAYLTQPQPNDVFLDPMCGAATIAIERALMARYDLILLGDLDVNAIQASCINIGRKHRPREILRWDARHLPLADRSIDKIATNLPFGVQIASKRELPRLYAGTLSEMERVLRSGGRAVLLAGNDTFLETALEKRAELALIQRQDVYVLGQKAAIRILIRY